ncbi:uncharacterized protein LOC115628756 [Scaptodrosophila lebanonensis]|uniref:Uncharacterized protein LOC115628756 n=1 Tax=Drosophila lebanonensis TaxID=7225 RepID=A0A6J2U131_DROLE|nr:uncharacterized protein LOC115628756 [Scaptodrosophila lebanonensis]
MENTYFRNFLKCIRASDKGFKRTIADVIKSELDKQDELRATEARLTAELNSLWANHILIRQAHTRLLEHRIDQVIGARDNVAKVLELENLLNHDTFKKVYNFVAKQNEVDLRDNAHRNAVLEEGQIDQSLCKLQREQQKFLMLDQEKHFREQSTTTSVNLNNMDEHVPELRMKSPELLDEKSVKFIGEGLSAKNILVNDLVDGKPRVSESNDSKFVVVDNKHTKELNKGISQAHLHFKEALEAASKDNMTSQTDTASSKDKDQQITFNNNIYPQSVGIQSAKILSSLLFFDRNHYLKVVEPKADPKLNGLDNLMNFKRMLSPDLESSNLPVGVSSQDRAINRISFSDCSEVKSPANDVFKPVDENVDENEKPF